MAIRKRERPAIDSAAIEAFGDAADAPTEAASGQRANVPASGAASSPAEASEWPAGMSKTFLLRYPDPTIPVAIEELQDLLSRNKHQTILLALRRGLDALRREAEELGDRADLIK